MAEIYALFSGRDGKVRYVGQTIGSRLDRFKYHQRSQIGRYISSVYNWIHEEWRHGYPVRSALLQSCSFEARESIETEWISKFPNLLNDRKRGYNYLRRIKPPVIPEIREYMGRYVFNSGGYHGIHWRRALDRYCVFIYRGPGTDEWLPGDAAPGYRDIWFSDRNDALNAREKYRRRWPTANWIPDLLSGD